MKAKFLIIGYLLLAIASCTSKVKVVEPVETPSSELCAIDSLMWRQPDSALAQLQRFVASPAADSLDVFNGHYCQLLISELLYKNYAAQSNRGELLRAVAYFDSLSFTLNDIPHARRRHCGPSFRECGTQSPNRNGNIVFLTARAHYIKGAGYYEHDSVVEACKEYLKALEVMEEHFEEKDLVGENAKFMAYVYTRLTGLSSDLYLHEQAIYFAHRSMIYYEKSDMPVLYSARILNEIGSQYDMMNRLDSATCYYQKAMDALEDTTTLMFRDIAMHVICLEYKTGVCQAGIATKKLHQLLLNSESDRETQVRLQNIGEIFYHEQSYDSAWAYLSTVFQTTFIEGLKRQSAEWLVEICKVQGRDDNILEYADFLVPFANQEENQSAKKSELTELYKAFGQAKLKLEHQREKRKQFRLALCVFLGLIVVLLIVVLLYQRNIRSKRHLETLIETERNEHKTQQAALSGRLKRSNAALREKEKMEYFDRPSKQSHYDRAENYFDEPICQRILSTCNDENNPIKSSIPVSSYANIALTDAQKVELKNAALAHYASLFKTLKQQHPELKEKDFLYCYLSLLGLDNAQIAVMTQLSYRTVWEREKRLQHIFQKEERISITLNEMMIN
jgi:tetratricopeptide (TPR) repeat protein